MKIPRIGVGVLIYNPKNQIILGERVSGHGINSFGPPGGHLEFGESFEDCAIRETKEETGLDIISPKYVALTNDVFEQDNKHYVSIFMKASYHEYQQIINNEPHKVVSWDWYSLNNLPVNLFLPLDQLIKNKAY